MFNTLKYARILEEAGFSRDQAETSIKILVEVMDEKMATKQDLQKLEAKLDYSMGQIESKLVILESRLTIKMGTMLAASIAVLTAIQKLI